MKLDIRDSTKKVWFATNLCIKDQSILYLKIKKIEWKFIKLKKIFVIITLKSLDLNVYRDIGLVCTRSVLLFV